MHKAVLARFNFTSPKAMLNVARNWTICNEKATSEQWLHEIKCVGYRVQAHVSNDICQRLDRSHN